MTGFALYRLPHASHAIFVQQTQGEPDELLSCQELNGRQGFVIETAVSESRKEECAQRKSIAS